jgi:hypothetical protein
MTRRTTLAEIFRAAGRAHHRAFAATNGGDPCWPEWYARDLAPTLSAVLGLELEPDALAADLKMVDARMRGRAPAVDWAQYYAEWLLARYSSHSAQLTRSGGAGQRVAISTP